MSTQHPIYIGATRARRLHMLRARECMELYRRTLDGAYVDMARVHVKTARAFNRHAWRAKGTT